MIVGLPRRTVIDNAPDISQILTDALRHARPPTQLGRDRTEVPDIVLQYEELRRVRTDVIQAETRKNGLRFNSRYKSLEQRDREIANSGAPQVALRL